MPFAKQFEHILSQMLTIDFFQTASTRGQPSAGTPGASKDDHKKKLSHLKNIDRKFIDMILNEAVEE